MKISIKKILFISLLVLLVSLIGCQGSRSEKAPYEGRYVSETKSMNGKSESEFYGEMDKKVTSDIATTPSPKDIDTGGVKNDEQIHAEINGEFERKIIRNASISINVESKGDLSKEECEKIYTQAVENLKKRCIEQKGYIQSYSEQQGYYRKEGTIVFKIPSEKFDDFVNYIKEIGSITYQSIQSTDITEEYYDIKSRLKNLKATEERLLSILSKASNVTEILQVEAELSRVRGDIESFEGQIKLYDNLVGFSTITLSIYGPSSIPMVEEEGFDKKAGNVFSESLEALAKFGEGIVYVLIAIVPWLPVILVNAGIIILIIVLVKRSIKKKKAKANSNTNAS